MYSIAPLSRSKLPTSLTITPRKPDYFRWLKNTFSTNVKKILHEVSNNNWFENFESPGYFYKCRSLWLFSETDSRINRKDVSALKRVTVAKKQVKFSWDQRDSNVRLREVSALWSCRL